MSKRGLFRRLQRNAGAKNQPPKHSRSRTTRLTSIETLEARWLMTGDPIPITFNIPVDVAARGVYAEISGKLTAQYVNSAGQTLQAGDVVYYDSTIHDYAQASATAPLTFQLSGNGAVVDLPNTYITAGQIVIGVGSAPIVTYTSSGIATPTASTNPTNYFGLFEYAITSGGLDIDLSEVDQVGFPFTITTDPAAPAPANDGVGIPLTRGDMFNQYGDYIAGQGPGAWLFQQSLTAGNGYRILAPQNVLTGPQAPTAGAPAYSPGGSLTIADGLFYYYWITATNAAGETTVSNVTAAKPYEDSSNGSNTPYATVNLSWSSYAGATGYNIYRSTTNNSATGQLVGSTSGATTFTDPGLATTSQTAPTNSYTYNPLNSYFNPALDAFFAHYTAPNSFQIERDGYLFSGQTNTAYVLEGHNYTVLELTTPSLAGQTFLIFKPYFQENTNIAGAPPAPSWMPHPTQSPAAMVLANDGAFNTGGAQPGVNAGILSDLENSIVSAFNRGIATNFALAPSNWAAAPTLNSAQAVAGGSLAEDSYYYVVTATNSNGETTPSLERAATTSGGNRSVALSWLADAGATQFNVYRSTTSGSGYQLVATVFNHNANPATSYVDAGTTTPTNQAPQVYYAPGSISNWYAGFLHQNATNNSATGISINGLAYGFPYDDQGGDSTNFQAQFNAVSINLMPWGLGPNPHHGPTATPTSLRILSQPVSGDLGAANSVTFQVLGPQGNPFFGGATVAVMFVGAQQGTYSVQTDAATGIGTLRFENTAIGFDRLLLELADGATFSTVVYHVASDFVPPTVFFGPTAGTGFSIPGQQPTWQMLGPNALPATDVPNAALNIANAIPWTAASGSLLPLGQSISEVTVRVESLEAGPLGIFAPINRGGGGALGPEQLPPPSQESEFEKAQTSADTKDAAASVALSKKSPAP